MVLLNCSQNNHFCLIIEEVTLMYFTLNAEWKTEKLDYVAKRK